MARENLIALGVCIGKFTHSSKFILTVGALDLLAQHAKFKVRACRRLENPRWAAQPPPHDAHTFSLQTYAPRRAAEQPLFYL